MKQANMFTSIDKLFALHNAMLLESRLIKAFFIYSLLMVVLYMLTSTKQTYSVRCSLYISMHFDLTLKPILVYAYIILLEHFHIYCAGLCIAFAIECGILQLLSIEIEQKNRLRTTVKSLFSAYAVVQLLYSLITYRYAEKHIIKQK